MLHFIVNCAIIAIEWYNQKITYAEKNIISKKISIKNKQRRIRFMKNIEFKKIVHRTSPLLFRKLGDM